MATPTIAVPRNSEELADAFSDPKFFDSFKSQDEMRDWVDDYGKQYAAKRPDADDIKAQVKDETEKVVAKMLAELGVKEPTNTARRLDLTPASAPSAARAAGYNPQAPGAKVDNLFPGGARDFLRATWHKASSPEALALQGKIREIQNSFGSTVPSDGGFLIPEYLRSELLQVALEKSLIRPLARVIPMETLTVPFPTIDTTSHASSVFGGVIAYWTEESGALTDTSAKFGRVKLEAKKLTAYSEVPNELFTDSVISLESFIGQVFPQAISWFEDVAFFSGTGVGEPLGFLNADAAVSVTKETNQVADTIVWENIVKMYSRMLPSSLGSAVWIAHIDTFPQLATMALSVGTGGSAIWLTNGAEKYPMTILGRPVYFCEKAASVGDAGDINFVDLSYYLIGDRQTLMADTSPHYKFANDQTAMRFITRVDGRPWIQSAITPQTGTNTLSPFVKVAARA